MAVLVTGGAGFIGSHVSDALLSEGFEVRVLDKLKPVNDKLHWFKGDILSKDDVHEAVRDVDAVFHLAAVADVKTADTYPELCLDVNEIGTLNLLQASTSADVERFILASTVWVYGRSSGAAAEEDPLPPPDNLYTKTKIGQEHLVQAWGSSRSLPFTILRYDIPYGPRMRANMAIASFVRKAIRKEEITIYGDGRQGRCWVFVTDLAQAHHLALKNEAADELVNLAGREFITVAEIVEILEKKVGKIPIRFEPERQGDFRGVRTSIEKAKSLLRWSPTTSFDEGLTKYLESITAT